MDKHTGTKRNYSNRSLWRMTEYYVRTTRDAELRALLVKVDAGDIPRLAPILDDLFGSLHGVTFAATSRLAFAMSAR